MTATDIRRLTDKPSAKQPHFAFVEMLSRRMVIVVLTTAVAFAGLFTIFGPIGTYVTFTPLQRIVYVGVVTGFGMPIYFCSMVVTMYYMRFRLPWECTLAVVPGIAIGALPVTAMAYVMHVVVYPDAPIPDLGVLYLSAFAGAVSASLLFCYMVFQRVSITRGDPVATVAGGSTAALAVVPAVEHELRPPSQLASGGKNGNGTATRPVAFLRRLPDEVRGQIIFVKTESHYLRVHTTAGTCRLLLRFADAVDELADLGMQVHRSYWAAHDQVLGVEKRNNRTLLRLTGDHEIPVSRTYASSVFARHSEPS